MQEQVKQNYLASLNELNKKKEKRIFITVDGVSAKDCQIGSGLVDKLINLIPPKYYRLYKRKKGKFQMKQYWIRTPEVGQLVIFDKSYVIDSFEKRNKKKYMNDIAFFESLLGDSKCHILHIIVDRKHKYDKYKSECGDIFLFVDDNTQYDDVVKWITDKIKSKCKVSDVKTDITLAKKPNEMLSLKAPKVETDELTKKRIKDLQKKLRKLHGKLIDEGIGLNIVFQGIDAAGKSSTIRRVTKACIPHMFNVFGIGVPNPREEAHHYLWRFWLRVAEPGQIQIFDRSWWEQVLAQRVLNLDKDWKKRYDELNTFEKNLEAHKSYTIKFFMCIDKDTQQERFDERKSNPLKTWKVSASDEETRKQWDEYQLAFTDMLDKSEWHFVDARNKVYAREVVLAMLCDYIKKILKQ